MTFLCFRRCHFFFFSTHILTRRMTNTMTDTRRRIGFFNSHPHEEDDGGWPCESIRGILFNSHPHEEDDADVFRICCLCIDFSTHILTRRMTAILNKIFSFKIKLYIHYNILFAIFYIYNSILYPFFFPKMFIFWCEWFSKFLFTCLSHSTFPCSITTNPFSLVQCLCWASFCAFIAKNAFSSIFSLSGFFINFHVHRTDSQAFVTMNTFTLVTMDT